ncbi:Na(+)/H(+) antiporter subunit B [bacterium]|nr:Na(+)/H(+) antiporter subunit B [bacterium]
MKKIIAILFLLVLSYGIYLSINSIPFGVSKTKVGNYYNLNGVKDTGANNIVTAVVLNYRGFDTLGEVTVLFLAVLGFSTILFTMKKKKSDNMPTPPSLILSIGCKFLFPFVLLFGIYIFIHGHLSPGGGFQGGAVIASAFLLFYLVKPSEKSSKKSFQLIESLSGMAFIVIGILGLVFGNYFLSNFLPKGIAGKLISAGIIPLIYIFIGIKVGSELTGIIDRLMGKNNEKQVK